MLNTMQLKEWNRTVVAEIQSPFNRWVTGEQVGHEPTNEEAAEHFIQNNGIQNLEDKLLRERRHFEI